MAISRYRGAPVLINAEVEGVPAAVEVEGGAEDERLPE